MYKHILVPVDGSATSNRALREAIDLAKEQQAALRLVHVIDETPISLGDVGWMGDTELEDAFFKVGQKIMDQAQEQVRQAGLEAGSALLHTVGKRIGSVIVEEARHWPADLIVVGTHGRHGVEHLLLGSVAEGVIRTASVPVLLIRGQ